MKKTIFSKTERKYKLFNIVSKIVLYFILALTLILALSLLFAKTDIAWLVICCLLVLDIIIIIIVCSKLSNKRNEYLQLLQKENDSIVREGVFKDVYDAYKHDGFEINLTYDKLLFQEYHNNTIDIGIMKNGHEFFVVIDENAISIISDEETDKPKEVDVLLSQFETIEQIYLEINTFIDQNS